MTVLTGGLNGGPLVTRGLTSLKGNLLSSSLVLGGLGGIFLLTGGLGVPVSPALLVFDDFDGAPLPDDGDIFAGWGEAGQEPSP